MGSGRGCRLDSGVLFAGDDWLYYIITSILYWGRLFLVVALVANEGEDMLCYASPN